MKVSIALSGGVDSAVAAYLLQQEGHEVVAAFIKVWQPDFLPCSQDEDRVAAKRVAAALGIPFFVVDLVDVYKRDIVEYMLTSYATGETPNPDVACNKSIKFGALWQWAQAHGCDYIATGHHAQIVEGVLVRGRDLSKDQAYFLWELPNEDLSHILLPIGHMQKSEVRAVAEQVRLPSAARKDSQGLCFLGMLSMSDFLGHLIEEKKGDVVLVEVPADIQRTTDRRVVGTHTGVHTLTLGQRGGFTATEAHKTPLFVVEIDAATNTVYVAEDTAPFMRATLCVRSLVAREPLTTATHAEVRYHGEAIQIAHITYTTEKSEPTQTQDTAARITLTKPVLVARGQSCVLYRDNVCIGGGVVTTG